MTSAWSRPREIPPALPDEIVRVEALSRLERRWHVPVTTVTAGAGFGKSTVLAQARRLQSLAPDGHEVYHRCDAGDETADRLADALVAAIARRPRASNEPISDVVEAIRAWAPVPVCVLLDDVHELPDESSGALLVAELVERLPDHAHVVLVGRRLPPVRLAHLQAADRLLRMDASDLAFDDHEIAEIAERSARASSTIEHLGGWPALVRLTLTAPVGSPRQYLWDEVISALDPSVRDAMPVLALAGELDADEILGLTDGAVDAEVVAGAVPLIDLADGGGVRCHRLWRDVVQRVWDRDALDVARRRVVNWLSARGEIVRAGSVAIEGRNLELVREPATALVGSTIGAFPADTGERWLRTLGRAEGDDPAVDLLRAATLQARNPHDPQIAGMLDRLLDRDDVDASIVIPALAIAGVEAHAVGDRAWLARLLEHARRFAGRQDDAISRLVLAGISAASAELDGDIQRGLADVEALGLGPALGDTVARFYVHLLILAGRADEAVPVADAIAAGAPRIGASRYPAFARWCAGDPSAILEQPADLGPEPGTNDRFRYAHFLRDVAICASLHRLERLDVAMAELGVAAYRSPKDRAQLVVAQAAADITRGSERTAVERFARHLAEFPADDPTSAVHLRRYPALGYPLSPDDAALWDRSQLGPTLERQLGIGELFVDLREGREVAVPLPTVDELVTSMPLVWSVELLGRAFAVGDVGAVDRLAELSSVTDGRAHDVLDALVADGRLPESAAVVADMAARPESSVLRVEVISGCSVSIDDVPVDVPELRRARVRQLLAMLVADGPMTRDRIMTMMWPDRDRSTASRNLRVTLTYVRRVLGLAPGAAESELDDDGEVLDLRRHGRVTTDVWDLRRAAADLAAAREAHDALAIEEALSRIVTVDARAPLPDLENFSELCSVGEWCRAEVLDGLSSLGERRLTQGRASEALSLANAARTVSPWSERAGRLAIAAQLLCGDVEHAAAEATRMQTVLDELGVEPDDRTRLLLARARHLHAVPTAG